MSRTLIAARKILIGYLVLALSSVIWAESKYAGPFENYKRTRDKTVFDQEIAEIRESGGIDFRQDIPFLIDLVASSGDLLVENQARDVLFGLAYYGLFLSPGLDPSFSELFRPAVAIFESHLDEALKEPEDTHGWSHPIASLTAFVGLQPSPRTLTLFYRMAKSKSPGDSGLGLIALARLKPLPLEAKNIILSRTKSTGLQSNAEILSFAIDDPDVMKRFLKSLESDNVDEQRAATKRLSWMGAYPAPIRDALRRLQQRKDLDEDVFTNVKAAIERIDNKLPIEDK
jgi:hypothetical protein